MAPVALAAANIAITSIQLFGKNGGSIGDLMGIQTEMLRNISLQLGVIQENMELILEKLEEVYSLIELLPEKVGSEIHQKELQGVLESYNEVMSGYIDERDTVSILSANDIYMRRFNREVLEPIVEKRNVLLEYKNPVHIPLVAAALQVEIHTMIISGRAKSEKKATLHRYQSWLENLLSETNPVGLPSKIEKSRNQLNKVRDVIPTIYVDDLCQMETVGGGEGPAATRLINSRFFFTSQGSSLSLDELKNLAPILNADQNEPNPDFLFPSDLPDNLVPNLNEPQLIEFHVLFDAFTVVNPRPDLLHINDVNHFTGSILPSLIDCKAKKWNPSKSSQSLELEQKIRYAASSVITLISLNITAKTILSSISRLQKELLKDS